MAPYDYLGSVRLFSSLLQYFTQVYDLGCTCMHFVADEEAEGIPIITIEYKDNQDVLNLIEGKGGLLIMLDDATTGVKQNDLQYLGETTQALMLTLRMTYKS